MDEGECLAAISTGAVDAFDLLIEAMPSAEREFAKIDRTIVSFLEKVRVHFPDAEYYTASGGFHLLLGKPHNIDTLKSQQQLTALTGNAKISDGDF